MLLQKLIIWQNFPMVTHLNLCKLVSIVNKKINVGRKNILISKKSQFNLQCTMKCKMAPHAFQLVVLLPTVVHLFKWESHLLNVFKFDWGLSSSYLTNITSNGEEAYMPKTLEETKGTEVKIQKNTGSETNYLLTYHCCRYHPAEAVPYLIPSSLVPGPIYPCH